MTEITYLSWLQFKNLYNKVYSSNIEDLYRENVYLSNVENMKTFNSQVTNGYYLNVNVFSDETPEEALSKRTGLILTQENLQEIRSNLKSHNLKDGQSLPSSFDLRGTGYVSSVKDQGNCGSCWAFSAAGAVEGQSYAKFGNIISPSEEQLVDCLTFNGNDGCQGGIMTTAYDYMKDGIIFEGRYPYTAGNGKVSQCMYSGASMASVFTGTNGSSSYNTVSENETDIMSALYNIGPLSIAVCVDNSFSSYSSNDTINIYKNIPCTYQNTNHAILLVGWGIDSNNSPYWICKNQWGSNWGDNGYIYIARGMSLIKSPTYPINLSKGPIIPDYPNNNLDLALGLGLGLGLPVLIFIVGTIFYFYVKNNKKFKINGKVDYRFTAT